MFYCLALQLQHQLRYRDLKSSAEVLQKKVPRMTAAALKTALDNISKDVEPAVMVHLFISRLLLARSESAYSLNEGCRRFGKSSDCFMIFRWPVG